MDDITEPEATRSSPPRASPLRRGVILVGRAREQALLREELAEAMAGRGRLVLLGGEAGIGKTSLARDLARDAELNGVRVISGHCYDLTNTPPFGPWFELVRQRRADAAWPQPPGAFRGGLSVRVLDQAALFSETRRWIADFSSKQPLYLLLEDLHWSDPASIDLLRNVAPYLGELPVLLVATYRDDELTRHHPLFQHLPGLIRDADASRIEPRALNSDALLELVRSRYRLSVSDEARLVSYLELHADGNPFFAVELMRAIEEKGLVRTGSDRSTLGELARLVVPALLRQVIDTRVSRLGEEIRAPLEIAAIIGQEVSFKLWSEMSDRDEESLMGIAERLCEAHVIEHDRNGTHVHFVHALTRETIYAGISPPRRRGLHRRIGETLAADPGADPDVVAVHLDEAGDSDAWRWYVRAGDRAQRVYAWVTAATRLKAAASLLEGVEGEERTYSMLVFRLSHLLRFSDLSASLAAIDEVSRVAKRLDDPLLDAEARSIRGIHLCYRDEFRAGIAEMQKSLEVLESSHVETTRIYAALRLWFSVATIPADQHESVDDDVSVQYLNAAGLDFRRCTLLWFSAVAGKPDFEDARRFIATLDAPGTQDGGVRSAIAFAFHALGIGYAAMGDPDEARRCWTESKDLFEIVEHYALISFCNLTELRDVAMTFGLRNPSYRRRLAGEAAASMGQAGGAFRPGISPRLAWLGCHFLDGRWDKVQKTLCSLPEAGNSFLRREIVISKAMLAHHQGRPETAWEEIQRTLPEGPLTQPGNNIHQEGLALQRLAVEMSLDSGNLDTARQWLEAHDRWLAWNGCVLGRADGSVVWARWHLANGDMNSAVARALDALKQVEEVDQPLVEIRARRLLGEVAGRSGDLEGGKNELARAHELSVQCELPFERALTLLVLAELALADSLDDSATQLLDEAEAILSAVGAEPALHRLDDIRLGMRSPNAMKSNPAGLTRRELDVLRLIGRHQTDKEIAEALFISPYTASTHVKHVLTKLGVANRREAADYAAGLATS